MSIVPVLGVRITLYGHSTMPCCGSSSARCFEAGRFSAWVMTIAARTVIDELRRRTDLAPALEIIDDDERPDRRSERRATVRAIEDAVGNLPPEYRAAFVLRAYHELEYGEIADALGIDIGTVKSRLWRARAQLQAALAEVRDER
jgi:RNA polymerase sigma-70 factor (ECF subfamily)